MSKRSISESIRQQVEKRAAYRCEYCQTIMESSTQRFEMEHIIPLSKGGQSLLKNLALSCRGCNSFKQNKMEGFDSLTELFVPLFNPRKDIWKEHFAWDTNPLFLIGLTATGRATIETLKPNRSQLIGVRKLLEKINLHPPAL